MVRLLKNRARTDYSRELARDKDFSLAVIGYLIFPKASLKFVYFDLECHDATICQCGHRLHHEKGTKFLQATTQFAFYQIQFSILFISSDLFSFPDMHATDGHVLACIGWLAKPSE